MTAWLTAATAGLVAYLMRAAVPLATNDRELPPRVVVVTQLVAPALIAALLAGSLAASADLAVLGPRLIVLTVGIVTAIRTQSIPWTIAAGLATHTLIGIVA